MEPFKEFAENKLFQLFVVHVVEIVRWAAFVVVAPKVHERYVVIPKGPARGMAFPEGLEMADRGGHILVDAVKLAQHAEEKCPDDGRLAGIGDARREHAECSFLGVLLGRVPAQTFAVGRKNWLFVGCHEGGERSAVILTVTRAATRCS